MKKLLKDLLYSTDNAALDISRLCSLLAVLTYLGLCIHFYGVLGKDFSPVEFGTGLGTTFAGCAAWIYARQKWEVEVLKAKNPPPDLISDAGPHWGGPNYGYGYGPRGYGGA